ncbi:hypothetical protein J2R99_000682 [Rhodopseudomonas julia]|uniref:Uncharacterized protein n=1 Tax=Rhodopseudomonas julia TaxID=200617 RepID=A0ABU0C3Q4_9BRAD|nr:hypothetical protein [Rhodopseudomonas julia]MDQ0324833.1 hypothetical protein [Rhodopseudomonas julia]
MRQTEQKLVGDENAGGPVRRPAVFETFGWYAATTAEGGRAVALFASERVVIERTVAGMRCLLDVAHSAFKGVRLVREVGGYCVVVEHDEPGLTLTLAQTLPLDEAQAFRDALSAHLKNGFAGDIHVSKRFEGRRSKLCSRRRLRNTKRPRFLARRRIGGVGEQEPIEGHELIARS